MKMTIDLDDMTLSEINEGFDALLWHGECENEWSMKCGNEWSLIRRIAAKIRAAKEAAIAEREAMISTLTFEPDNKS